MGGLTADNSLFIWTHENTYWASIGLIYIIYSNTRRVAKTKGTLWHLKGLKGPGPVFLSCSVLEGRVSRQDIRSYPKKEQKTKEFVFLDLQSNPIPCHALNVMGCVQDSGINRPTLSK